MIIICHNPFELSSIAKIGNETYVVSSSLEGMVNAIETLANNNNDYVIRIDSSPNFVEEIKQQLTTTKYSKEKFDVEGI